MSSAARSRVLQELANLVRERDLAAERLQRQVLSSATAGISQREIARTLGVTQPAVSQMIAAARARTALVRGPIGRKLSDRRNDVLRIAKSHGASRVRVFGSVSRGDDDDDSDLDLLVDMPGEVSLFGLVALENELSDALGVPVDVVPEQIVKQEELRALSASSVPL